MPMSRRALDEFLEAPRIAHFATIGPGGVPWVRPVWYVWENDALFFTTRLRVRRTGADIAAGSAAGVSIASDGHPYQAVLARGIAALWRENRMHGWNNSLAGMVCIPGGTTTRFAKKIG